MRRLPLCAGVVLFWMSWAASAPPVLAIGGDACVPTSCNAPTPACGQTTTGVNNCGESCSLYGGACCIVTSCDAPEPSCSQPTTTGMSNCGTACYKDFYNYCDAPTPACGQTTTGTWSCGGTCTKTGPACGTWKPYGFAVPGDPLYSFTAADNHTKNFLGLAAKGNIVIGDYTDVADTDADFVGAVLPKLRPGADSITRPYVIDPTDAALGYHDFGYDAKDRPLFSGNYDKVDGGTKLDGSARKFYESSLADAAFRAVLDTNGDGQITAADDGLFNQASGAKIDAVLFTNHALAGYIKSSNLEINGSMVARDDGLIFGKQLHINHDVRLLDDVVDPRLLLPFSIKRPRLMRWEEIPN